MRTAGNEREEIWKWLSSSLTSGGHFKMRYRTPVVRQAQLTSLLPKNVIGVLSASRSRSLDQISTSGFRLYINLRVTAGGTVPFFGNEVEERVSAMYKVVVIVPRGIIWWPVLLCSCTDAVESKYFKTPPRCMQDYNVCSFKCSQVRFALSQDKVDMNFNLFNATLLWECVRLWD